MFHPVYFQKGPTFTPIGDNTANCLTQNLPPEEPAIILLLESGDPRSILFTVYSSGVDTAAVPRTLDFTCCEADPAILARNVLLFTLIADDESPEKIWNIFFHFYLDQTSLALLLSKCRKLVKLSKDLKTWRNSSYASFLRMCSSHTLSELHRHWTYYSKNEENSRQGKRLKDRFAARAKLEPNKSDIPLSYSAGPLSFHFMTILSGQFDHFWQTGLTSTDPKDLAASTFANPTFAYSLAGEGFAVREGTNPLLPFHLASALAPTRYGSKRQKGATTPPQVIESVRLQFQEGCRAFRETLKSPGKLVVRSFVGDSTAFCHALHYCSHNKSTSPGMYISHWSATPLDLDGGEYAQNAKLAAPLTFNVIETSKLAESIGMLNVLIAAVPILSRAPSSALYTEAILSSRGDAITGFLDYLLLDIPMTSLLFGVIPTSYVSNFSSHSNVHEILAHLFTPESPPFHKHVTWKTASLGDPVASKHDSFVNQRIVFDPPELTKFLFSVYLRMFGNNETTYGENLSLRDLAKRRLIHHVPETFAVLLQVVRDRTRTDWKRVMNALLILVEEDTTLLTGMKHYEDLCCQLHLHRVHSVDSLSPNEIVMEKDMRGPFCNWENVPPLVCVVIVVPRKNAKVLDDPDVQKAGALLQCELRVMTRHGRIMHHIFSSINVALGTVSVTGSTGYNRITIEEDPARWSGITPMVVSFWVPSWLLVIEPNTTSISLAVRSTPTNNASLLSKLGKDMKLFEMKLTEKDTYVVRERPNLSGVPETMEMVSYNTQFALKANNQQVSVTLGDSYRSIWTLTVKVDIVEETAKMTLGAGAAMTVVQVSPYVMKLSFRQFSKLLVFPFPVEGTHNKIRIARKSMYVEVIVPVAGSSIVRFNPYPVILKNRIPTLWNIHYINLDRLPILDTTNLDELEWVNTNVSLSLSDRERAIHEKNIHTEHDDVMVNIKADLCAILVGHTGVGKKVRVFGLSRDMGGIDTLIFVTDLRLDLASHTIVADACILPMTPDIVEIIGATLYRLHISGIGVISVAGEHMKAWKRLLPVFTERCRKWEHKSSCEYIKKGFVPISVEHSEIPLCGCGKGVETTAFSKVPEWKALAGLVTRAAIGPLFAVSYLENVGLEGSKKVKKDM